MTAPTQRVAITGASGLIGRALTRFHERRGDTCVPVSRSPHASPRWSLVDGVAPADAFSGCDVLVHLAGENVASGRWTAARKAAIRDSRVLGTQHMVEALRRASPRPTTFICASATGFYGDSRAREVDESSPPADDFLGRTSAEWEAAAHEARALGIRVVSLRFGVVLSEDGGALPKMHPFFKAGLGGTIGDGRQPFPWVHIDDVVGAYAWALDADVDGPVNVVAPTPTTNAEFTKSLGRALRRPTLLPVPAFALRVAFGEMSTALLTGARVTPRVLN
ncbi:MAG: TIGR01777 family oxidoreductase, partial [Nannocystaceae bacterium]